MLRLFLCYISCTDNSQGWDSVIPVFVGNERMMILSCEGRLLPFCSGEWNFFVTFRHS